MISPVTKVSSGIVLLILSVMFLGELLGLVPNEQRAYLEARKQLAESLAVQFSLAANLHNTALIESTLKALVQREDLVQSAAILDKNEQELITVGQHRVDWLSDISNKSTAEHVQVPIYADNKPWGTLQIAFAPIQVSSVPYSFGFPLLPLSLFMLVLGFVLTRLFVRKVITELDPKSVIPERVRSAFDALAEGLVIIDDKQRIILANAAFADKVDIAADKLIGRTLDSVDFELETKTKPWIQSLENGEKVAGITIRLSNTKTGPRLFAINTTPIYDGKKQIRGVLGTFDDLTDLERKQVELRQTVAALQESRSALQEKTMELEYLASRDPMTGCFNRRAFFDKAQALFDHARESGEDLVCIMTDIDHFKRVNDNFGHAMGDKVIKMVAGQLRHNMRSDDLVGRYGGEEFCIILPDISMEKAAEMADRLRENIHAESQVEFDKELAITSSFGVALLAADLADLSELINRADEALYAAKESGRNRVAIWHEGMSANTIAMASEELLKDVNSLAAATEANLGTDIDELTKLPNRKRLTEVTKQVIGKPSPSPSTSALLIIDIDMFRRINQALGMPVGDAVIRVAATRIQEVLRESDLIAGVQGQSSEVMVSRSGIDEFAVLLSNVANAEHVKAIAERIMTSLTRPVMVDGRELFITCSAGVSLYPQDAEDGDTLMKHANTALHDAKDDKRANCISYYSTALDSGSYQKLLLEGELRHAMERDELSLNYQPKIDLESNTIAGMEALIRWQHEQLGNVSPVDFIPIAERTGLISGFWEWTINTACEQVRQWHQAGFEDVSVALNVSGVLFRDDHFVTQIIDTIGAFKLNPRAIGFEVTETILVENFTRASAALKALSNFGCPISLDDFGTGYSSLAYLKHLPIDTLKIDRSFVNEIRLEEMDEKIIRAIIAMSRSMDLTVVAEGVETEAQLSVLRQLKCDEVQGYLFSKPVSGDASLGLLYQYNQANRRAG